MKNINVLKQYEDFMQTSKDYPVDKLSITYPALGLNGEAGEVAEKVKKCWRDNNGDFTTEIKEAILKELADVLWYIWATADDMGYTLEDVFNVSMQKVKKRQETNTVHGNGDNREKKKNVFNDVQIRNIENIENSNNKVINDKQILAITTDVFEELKELQYNIKFINRTDNINITIIKYINDTKEIHTYKGKFKGISKMDGAILVELENKNDITKILQILSENDYNEFIVNETVIHCPQAREVPLAYM